MIEGGLYHVYNRFARGEDVFTDPGEAIGFIDSLHETKARDGFSVLARTLMSNHFHVALRTSAVPLSRTMHYLQNGFSRGFNRRWRRTGPLWQSRYKPSGGTREPKTPQPCSKNHPIAVSRRVSETGMLRIEDDDFAAELESLDQTLSTKALERLEDPRTAERQS